MNPKHNADFVLDCSVAAAWCLVDEDRSYADVAWTALEFQTAHVPAIWPFELFNVLSVAQRQNRISPAQCARFLDLLGMLRIEIESPPPLKGSNSISLINLAETYKLSIYDAAYLELAARRGLHLATLDKALKKAASLYGVGLLAE